VGEGWEKISPRGGRGRGEERPFREGEVLEEAALRRSSVALRRASRASSSEVWEETFCFLRFKRLVGIGERGRGERGEGRGERRLLFRHGGVQVCEGIVNFEEVV
jgi:hypothetical protein